MKPKILAFAGSTRTESYNKKLIKIAVAGAEAAGAEVTLIDLRDFPMPLYDGDFEEKEGLPQKTVEFKKLMQAHHGIMISSPEYNSSITGVLKNTIDWASRSQKGEAPVDVFEKKVAVLMSASPGALGGLRGLTILRPLLSNMNVLVLPQQVAISKAHEAFAAEGALKESKQQKSIEKLGADLAAIITKLQA